jgi:hypothetical protein
LVKALVITRLRSSVFSSRTTTRTSGRSRYDVARAPRLLQVMKRWRACGRLSSSQSTTARLSGLFPERASDTTRKEPFGGRQVSGWVRIRPAGTAVTGTPRASCRHGATHSPA